MGQAMQAAVIHEPKRARLERVPRPIPAANQLRVRLEGSGVCGSNLPVWEGRPWLRYPFEPGAPGHEGWGVVDAIGSEIEGLRPGDRVAFVSGRAFAEYDLVEAGSAVKLPAALADMPFPGEPLGCAFNIHRRSDIRRYQTVAIIGIGFLGAVLTRLAANAGARVIAISRRPWALGLARRMGADETVPLGDPAEVLGAVREITGGALCERVIEVVGTQGALDLAGELTCERGRLIIGGYHQDGPRQVNLQLWNWRGLDVINAHERDPVVSAQGIRDALEAVAAGVLDPTPLFTHSFRLEELGKAFEAMGTRPEGFLKALIRP